MKLGIAGILITAVIISAATFYNVESTQSGDNKIEWITFDEAVEKGDRPIFIDVYTDWCGWCKKMDRSTFSNDEVVNYVNKNFYAVKLDAESRSTVSYNNKEITKAGLALNVFGVRGYPTIVYYDAKNNQAKTDSGYKTADQFMATLKAFKAALNEQ